MLVSRLFFAVAGLATAASAQLTITNPGGPDLWWVAQSQNVVSWTCGTNTQFQSWQLLVANTNPTILVSAQSIISNVNNFTCSMLITTQQEVFPAATGYTIIFASALNSSDVFATSEPFEIKSVGSAYPATSSASTPSSTGSGSSSGSAATPSQTKNAAVGVSPKGLGLAGALIAGAAALVM